MKLTDEQLAKVKNILIIILAVSLVFTAVASIAFIKTKKSDSNGGYTKSNKKTSTTVTDSTTEEPSSSEIPSETEPSETNPPPSIDEVKPPYNGEIVMPEPYKMAEGTTVYLTFDDGPNYYTKQILDVLDAYGVKATFFVMNGGNYNHYMKDIVNRGHQIGLHTYSHNYKSLYATEQTYFEDLGKISAVVKEQTGVDTRLIRFPGGTSNTVSKCSMKNLTVSVTDKGYFYYDWNTTNGDAAGASGSKTISDQLRFCSQFPKSSKEIVVLMHDKELTAKSLPYIIEYYQSCGAKFGVLGPGAGEIHHRPAK